MSIYRASDLVNAAEGSASARAVDGCTRLWAGRCSQPPCRAEPLTSHRAPDQPPLRDIHAAPADLPAGFALELAGDCQGADQLVPAGGGQAGRLRLATWAAVHFSDRRPS